MVDVYADEGISGTSIEKRTDFKRMIEDCKTGKIDMVVTKSISRFARNTMDCLNYVRQLKEKDIAVFLKRKILIPLILQVKCCSQFLVA